MLRSFLVAITATICIAVTACSDSQWVLRESQARSWCAGPDTAITPDLRISGCTTLIQSGRETQSILAVAFCNRGNAYQDYKGDYDRAIQDYDQAIRLKPDYAIAFYNRGYAYQHKGDYDRAIQDYDQAVRLKPDDAAALNNRCWARAVANKALEAALSDCNESLRLRPDDAGTMHSRGFVHFRMGRYDEAIADFDNSLSRDPKSADMLYMRGLAKGVRHDTAGSDADIAEAKAIDPKVAERYAGYGVKP